MEGVQSQNGPLGILQAAQERAHPDFLPIRPPLAHHRPAGAGGASVTRVRAHVRGQVLHSPCDTAPWHRFRIVAVSSCILIGNHIILSSSDTRGCRYISCALSARRQF